MADTTTGQRAFSRGEESAHEESESLLSRAPSDRAHRPRTGVLWGANVAVEPEGDDASSLPEGRRTCIENLSMTVRVFFVRGLFVGRRWVFPLLLACTAASYEIAASTILGVIGDFYLAISSMDATLFVQVLWRSLLVVTVVACLKAARDLAKEACALVWRQGLVSFLHCWYMKGKTPYMLSTAEAGRTKGGACGKRAAKKGPARLLDNPDQRITADADALTTAFASIVHKTLVVPGLVLFYTWYLVGMFGWTAPVACYLYFIVASTVNWAVVRKVVPAVYAQERAEGTFRYDHASLRAQSESVVFCGVEAVEGRERDRLSESFDAAVAARWLVIRRHVPLYVLTQFFDYLGSIINYAAVGGAILYLSKAEGMEEAEISGLIARGSYSCLYLIDAFSQALRASKAASRVGGSAGRVAELLRTTGFSDNDARKLGPWSAGTPSPPPPPSAPSDDGSSSCSNGRDGGSGGSGGVGGGGGGGGGDRRGSAVDERRDSASTAAALRSRFSWSRWVLPWEEADVERGTEGQGQRRGIEADEECGWKHPAGYAPLPADPVTAGEVAGRSAAGNADSRRSNTPVGLAVPEGMAAAAAGVDAADVGVGVSVDGHDDWLLRIDGYTVAQPEHRDVDRAGAMGSPSADGGRARWRQRQRSASLPATASAEYCGSGRVGSIVRELTVSIRRGRNLLVIGPSGCGKTSLFRAIAGLWEAEGGKLEVHPRVEAARRAREDRGTVGSRRPLPGSGEDVRGGGVVFLPQRPYCFRGTLVEQVTYPLRADGVLTPTIYSILASLDLAHLLPLGLAAPPAALAPENRNGNAYPNGNNIRTGTSGVTATATRPTNHRAEGGGATLGAVDDTTTNSNNNLTDDVRDPTVAGFSVANRATDRRDGESAKPVVACDPRDFPLPTAQIHPASPAAATRPSSLPLQGGGPRGDAGGAAAATATAATRTMSVTDAATTTTPDSNSIGGGERSEARSSPLLQGRGYGGGNLETHNGGVSVTDTTTTTATTTATTPHSNKIAGAERKEARSPPVVPLLQTRGYGGGNLETHNGGVCRQANSDGSSSHVCVGITVDDAQAGGVVVPAATNDGGVERVPQPPPLSPPPEQRDWASILSIGEQQRLGVARVLYHRPALAFLDESTSAVTEDAEKQAYRLMRAAGVTIVAIGHRSSLHALHERVLRLRGAPDGAWELSET